jgi:hypothetical protein
MHDRVANDCDLVDLVAVRVRRRREIAEQAVDRLPDDPRAAPSSCTMAYETRLMRSSPNRICGFMTPAEARISPVARSAR